MIGRYIHPQGGPSLIIDKKMRRGKECNTTIPFLKNALVELSQSKSTTVAVLTPYVETLKFLQRVLLNKEISKNILIESVDRVQGLDVDYCFYVIPNYAYDFPFDFNRFNVATSRSKKATIIIAPDGVRSFRHDYNNPVWAFIKHLSTDFCLSINSDQILSGKPSILEVNDSGDRYKAARETLFSLGLIENGGCYNSLVDKKGNVLAEAEFVLVFKNRKIAVDPFSKKDQKVFLNSDFEILNINNLLSLLENQ